MALKVFKERGKPTKQFSVIGRYDYFDPNLDAKQDQSRLLIKHIKERN